jgi:chorismate mutase / prephenate dehydratase
MPQEGEPDPWWRHLFSTGENAPRVIARLPFGACGNSRNDGVDALAVGRFVQQETGLDRTLLTAECAANISRARVLRILSSVRLVCTLFASCDHVRATANLIEVEGFVTISDARLDEFRAELGEALHRLVPIGGYAVPLPVAALASRD